MLKPQHSPRFYVYADGKGYLSAAHASDRAKQKALERKGFRLLVKVNTPERNFDYFPVQGAYKALLRVYNL